MPPVKRTNAGGGADLRTTRTTQLACRACLPITKPSTAAPAAVSLPPNTACSVDGRGCHMGGRQGGPRGTKSCPFLSLFLCLSSSSWNICTYLLVEGSWCLVLQKSAFTRLPPEKPSEARPLFQQARVCLWLSCRLSCFQMGRRRALAFLCLPLV